MGLMLVEQGQITAGQLHQALRAQQRAREETGETARLGEWLIRSGVLGEPALIGLAGEMSGSLVLHASSAAAIGIAARMAGMEMTEVDAMVRDAVGEVCNMVAGAWKGFDPVLASGCLLSTPTVVAGTSYELFSQRAPVRIERRYRFEHLSFTVSIYCEPPK
jgi:CheY-specific phosphatase CheX